MPKAAVIKLPTARKPAKPATERKPSAIAKRQRLVGYSFGAIAVSLTALSLSHLAEGVSTIAHRAAWEGWAVAGGVDVGFILAELMPFCVSAAVARNTAGTRRAYAFSTLAASAACNAFAFARDANGACMVGAAVALGVALPLAIATLTHLASRCVIGRHD